MTPVIGGSINRTPTGPHRRCDMFIYVRDFPQQLPGPAQPASVGLVPQQAVSPGPGNLDIGVPDRDDGVEIIFLRLVLLQV